MRSIFAFSLFFAATTGLFSQNYDWQNVAIGGGGYALQTTAHPTQDGVIFMASDVAGLFRWTGGGWHCLQDWNGPDSSHLYGCDGFALDKNNPATIFAAFGKYACYTGGIFKSTDSGDSWTRVRPTRVGSNQDRREVQTSIAIDPNNSSTIYAGTRTEGFLRSTDGGTAWSVVGSVGAGNVGDPGSCYWSQSPIGIRAVEIDGSSVSGGNSAKIYAAVHETGVFRSLDGGLTFALMAGSPVLVNRISVSPSSCFATADDGVFKFDGTNWTNVTPAGAISNFFNALQIDPADPQKIICSTGNYAFNQEVFRSLNGGISWAKISVGNGQAVPTFSVPWFPTNHFMSATASLSFDALHAGRVYLTDWYSVWKTENIWASPVAWAQLNAGYEVTVNLALSTPPSGAPLFSGMADVVGFRHTSTGSFPAAKLFGASECTGIDFQENNPQQLAAVISDDWDGGNTRIIKSSNGGTSWAAVAVPTGKKCGKIAISATNPQRMVYLPAQSGAYFTTNGGTNWTASTGGPTGVIEAAGIFQYQNPLVADRLVADKFYLYKPHTGKVYRSIDGGATWAIANAGSLPTGYNYNNFCNLSAGFNAASAGHLWVSLGENGLWRSLDGGMNFTQIAFFEIAKLSALGKPMAGSSFPTAFVYGKNAGDWGIFRSTDNGTTWVKINDAATLFGDDPTAMAADRQTAGRVFTGSNGRGIWQGTDNAALPVETTDFWGRAAQNFNELHWATASEAANSHFKIERAAGDDGPFFEIGQIAGHGFSTEKKAYQFADRQPIDRAFYRIRQVDLDGKSSLSNVISIERESPLFEVSPNPVAGVFCIKTKVEWSRAVVKNALGQPVRQFVFGENLTLAGLPDGLFFMEIFSDESGGAGAVFRVVKN